MVLKNSKKDKVRLKEERESNSEYNNKELELKLREKDEYLKSIVE